MEYRKVSIPMQGKKATISPSRVFLQVQELFIETLIEEMKPVNMGDK